MAPTPPPPATLQLVSLLPAGDYIQRTPTRTAFDDMAEGGPTLEVFTRLASNAVDGPEAHDVCIRFECVAEARTLAMYFPEAFYDQYTVADDSGFFEVQGSTELTSRQALYDPHGRLGLRHFLLYGYDSHFHVLASGWRISHLGTHCKTPGGKRSDSDGMHNAKAFVVNSGAIAVKKGVHNPIGHRH